MLCVPLKPGCHARSVPQDLERSWEAAVEQINDYLTNLNTKADELVKDIQSTQVAREME